MGTGEPREGNFKMVVRKEEGHQERESHPAQRTFEEGRKGLQGQMPQTKARTDRCPAPRDLAPCSGLLPCILALSSSALQSPMGRLAISTHFRYSRCG